MYYSQGRRKVWKSGGACKGGFFSDAMKFFQISKSQKKILQKTILSLKFKFPANNSKVLLAGNLNLSSG